MKSILIISLLTFVVLFGTILFTSGLLEDVVRQAAVRDDEPLDPQEQAAREQVFRLAAAERDALQRDRESYLAWSTADEVERKVLAQAAENLSGMIGELAALQTGVGQERDAQAAKLAKVYEAMKPASAAPILASLDLDIVLEIMTNMKDRQAAKILAFMNPGLAAEISTRMSSQGGSS
jgi:flagellar motility protein MotE (MotC chaperone)